MRIAQWWHDVNELDRRERDERARYIGLLATRDAFVAVVLLLAALVILQLFAGTKEMDSAAPKIVALLPIGALVLTGVVAVISVALRGGFTLSTRATTYRVIFCTVGLLVGLGFSMTLSWLGVGPSLDGARSTVVGMVTGSLTVGLSLILWSRRKNR